MKNLKGDNECLLDEDILIWYQLANEVTGEPVTGPTDFALRFYIKGRRKAPDSSYNEIVCSKRGSEAPAGCEIDENGNIYCRLPGNSFNYPGELIVELLSAFPSAGFEDGECKIIDRDDTGIYYKK